MSDGPRPIRALPNTPAPESESGVITGLVTRIVIVLTIVLGQLWALTVALEESLLDHDREAWWLAGFSIVSFIVVLVLTKVDPPPRDSRRSRQFEKERGLYVSRPAAREPQR